MIRIRRASRVVATPADMRKAEQYLQSVAQARAGLAEMQTLVADREQLLFEFMQAKKTGKVSAVGLEADIVTPIGRATNTIEPKALHATLPLPDFFKCVSVSNTKAALFLSGKELAAITKTTRPPPGDPTLVITKRKLAK